MRLFAMTALLASTSMAATIPFTENFDTDASNWRESTGGAFLNWNATGGPDNDAYASTAFSFANSADGDTPVIFRGHDAFDSSGDAFVGDYITEGVTEFSVTVRHNAPLPLTVFTRYAGAANFPGAIAINFAPILPNTWTTVTFAINPFSPQFISFEGETFADVFDEIANVQLGYEVPTGFGGNPLPITFDIDRPTIVPEPGSLLLLAGAGLSLLVRRR